jgi:hypothetical protein
MCVGDRLSRRRYADPTHAGGHGVNRESDDDPAAIAMSILLSRAARWVVIVVFAPPFTLTGPRLPAVAGRVRG